MLDCVKNRITQALYRRIGVAFNPYGVPYALGKHLEGRRDIRTVDVGAHRGDFTASLDRLCGVRGGILAELQPGHATHLRERFDAARFHVVEAAVCDRAGMLEVEVNEMNATTSILRTRRELDELSAIDVRHAATIRCVAVTLDTMLERHPLPSIDLLKLDVQGAEHLVIRGGEEALQRTEMIWTEVSFVRLYDGSCLLQDIVDLLATRGFSLYELEPGFRGPRGELLQADALFIRTK